MMDIEECIDYCSDIINVDVARAELLQYDAAKEIIFECENALADYVEQIEKQGATLGYGYRVLNLCRTWLAAEHARLLGGRGGERGKFAS